MGEQDSAAASTWDVMATLLAHGDRGDGFCDECHELDPCEVRQYCEAVLHERNRRRR